MNRGVSSSTGQVVARSTGKIVGLLAVQLAVMASLGLLIVGPLHTTWPFTAEDGVNRWFAHGRDATWNFWSNWGSHAADTGTIVAYAIVAGLVLRWVLGRWRESMVIAAAVAGEAAVFLACTVIVKRPRPHVPHLDVSPPTSSYPSGHVGASVAFWVALALVIAWHQRQALAKAAAWLLMAFPAWVAWSRLYRGMHHPSDVLLGAVDGLVPALIAAVVIAGGLRVGDSVRRGGARDPRTAPAQEAVTT